MASDSARLQVIIESQYQGAPGLEALRRDAQAAGVTIERLGVQTSAAGQQIARLQGTATGAAQGVAQQVQAQLPAARVGVTGPDPTALVRQRAQAEAQANAQAIAAEQQALAQVATARQRAEQQAERDVARLTATQERETQRQVAAVTRAIEQADAVRQREADRAARIAQRQAEAEVRAAKEAADAQVALVARVQAIRSSLASGQAVSFQVQGQTPQQLAQLQQNFRALGVDATQTGEKITQTGQRITTLQAAPGKPGVATGGSPLARAVAPAISGEINDQLARAEASGIRLVDAVGPKLTAGLRASNEEMSKLAQGIGHGLGLFSSFGAGIGTAVVTAAITAAIADTTRQFAVFDEQLRGTNALLGLTGQASEQSFQQMNRDVRAFAVATGTEAVNDTKALYQVLSAGIPVGVQAFQVLQAGANLAVGGLTDTKTAIDGVTSVLNAYRLNASDAAKISDQFFAATKAGKITVDQLAQGIGTAVPVAAALGVNFAELSGVIASATSQGVQAGAAFEGTRAALNAFLRPTAEAQQIAGRLGFEFDANVVKTKGFTGALNDAMQAVGGSPLLLGQLFGDIQAVNTVLAITGPNAAGTARAINTVSTASGDAARAADEVNQSLGRAFARAGAQAKELSLSIGQAAAGPLTAFLNMVTGIGQAFGTWPKTLPLLEQGALPLVQSQAQQLADITGATQAQRTRARQEQDRQQARQEGFGRNVLGPLLQNPAVQQVLLPIPGLAGGIAGARQLVADLGRANRGELRPGFSAQQEANRQADEARRRQDVLALAQAGGTLEQLRLNLALQAGTISQQEYARATQHVNDVNVEMARIEARGEQATYARAEASLAAADAANKEADATAKGQLQAARVHLPEVLPTVFAPQEAEIALQQAGLTQQADEQRLAFERQLDPLQRQLQTMEALRDITAETTVLHLNLERTLLDESHTRERALDLENQNLDATIRANDAREQGIRLGFVIPALQRVATAIGANVDPNSPEFQRLNVAQQFVALRLSTAQAQQRQGQIATDPGKLVFDAQSRELDFRTRTAQLATDELKTRLQIDELPLEQRVKQLEAAEARVLTPLQLRTAELKLQTDYYDRQKAVLQWMTTHVPPEQLSTAILAGVSPDIIKKIGEGTQLTPDDVKALSDAVTQGIKNLFPTTGTIDQGAIDAANKQIADTKSAADAAKAATDAAQANTTAAPVEVPPVPVPLPPNVPAPGFPPEHQGVPSVPQVQGGTLGPTEIGPPVPVLPIPDVVPQAPGGVPGAIGLGDQPTINQPPVIRGTGVQPARNVVVNNHVNVDASNQTDPNAIATATASATSQATIDAIQTEFSNSPSSNSIGAR